MAGTDAAAAHGRATERVLVELLALEREIVELEYVRRSDALARVSDAVRRLGELSVAEGILGRGAAALGASSDFDRVLISEVADGQMTPLTIWSSRDQARPPARALGELAPDPIRLSIRCSSTKVAGRGGAEVVTQSRAARARTPAPLAGWLRWESYVVAALIVGGETIGLLHADATASARAVDELDPEVAARYAESSPGVFERAVLRHTLELHRAELGSAVHWLEGRDFDRLEDAAGLAGDGVGSRRGGPAVDVRLVEALTKRKNWMCCAWSLAATPTWRSPMPLVRARGHGQVPREEHPAQARAATSRADAVAKFVRARRRRCGG